MECGNCTACCTLLEVAEIDKAASVVCEHCNEGCTVYSNRPDACAEFSCAYHQMKIASTKLRPDNCGIIFEKIVDDIMFGTVDPNHKDFKYVNGQINVFLNEGINVVLSKHGQPVVYHLDDVMPEDILNRLFKIVGK